MVPDYVTGFTSLGNVFTASDTSDVPKLVVPDAVPSFIAWSSDIYKGHTWRFITLPDNLDPTLATGLVDLAEILQQLYILADKPSFRELESRTKYATGLIPGTNIKRVPLRPRILSGVLQAQTFPHKGFLLTFVEACGVNLEIDERWEQAWDRLAPAHTPERVTRHTAAEDDNQTNLLLRVYIPSERLYAAEADRMLSLFRDWLITTRGSGIRQAGYRTASGQMYEFFADVPAVKADLREDFNSFSNFLTLCSTDPSAAAEMLAPMELGRTTSVEFVARFGREVRRLQIDLAHERERRILTIRHSLENELIERGVEPRAVTSAQLNALIESFVPGPSAADSLALLAALQLGQTILPVAFNINQQFINAVESTVIQNVRGTVHLGPKAKELVTGQVPGFVREN